MKISHNLLWTRINKDIYVSTAMIARTDWWGERFQIETWIFNGNPNQQSTHIVHKTRRKAIKVHKYICKNLLRKESSNGNQRFSIRAKRRG